MLDKVRESLLSWFKLNTGLQLPQNPNLRLLRRLLCLGLYREPSLQPPTI
jgi:hypothetical protein